MDGLVLRIKANSKEKSTEMDVKLPVIVDSSCSSKRLKAIVIRYYQDILQLHCRRQMFNTIQHVWSLRDLDKLQFKKGQKTCNQTANKSPDRKCVNSLAKMHQTQPKKSNSIIGSWKSRSHLFFIFNSPHKKQPTAYMCI